MLRHLGRRDVCKLRGFVLYIHIILHQTVVARGMTTVQGSERDGRRTEQENGRKTDQSQEKKVVEPQVLLAFDINGISNTYRLVGVDLDFTQHWNMLILRG